MKFLVILLVLSFALWGISDVFRGSVDDTVATVGDVSISNNELRRAISWEEERFKRIFGGTLDAEALQIFQIEKIALERVIHRKLLEQEAHHIGLAVGDEYVKKDIATSALFQGPDGRFSKDIFRQYLRQLGQSEQMFVNALKKSIVTENLINTLSNNPVFLDSQVSFLTQYSEEKRVAELFVLPSDYIKKAPDPSDSDLITFYDEEKNNFAAPETRDISYIVLNQKSVKDDITISQEELRNEYKTRLNEFQKPETRDLYHMLLDDETQAKKALERLQEGESFVKVAKEEAGQKKKDIKMESITKADLLEGLDEPVFALEKNAFSAPIETTLGWHIFSVTDITPEKTIPFKDAKKELKKELVASQSADIIYKLSTELEDVLAGGATLEEAGKTLNLKVKKLTGLKQEGLLARATEKKLPSIESFLPTVFETSEGELSSLIASEDNDSFFILRVDSVIPRRVKALDEVRGKVIEAWKKTKQQELLELAAYDFHQELINNTDKNMTDSLLKNKMLKEKSYPKLKKAYFTTSDKLSRISQASKTQVSQEFLDELFSKKTGSYTMPHKRADGAFVIGKLKEIIPVEDKIKASLNLQTTQLLKSELSNEVFEHYMRYLESRYPIEIFQEKLGDGQL